MQRDNYSDEFGLSATDLKGRLLAYGHETCANHVTSLKPLHPVIYYAPVDDVSLPFADFTFDMSLCPHYLFTQSVVQEVDFHLKVIRELARVGKEVRIFPLIDNLERLSPLLGPVLLGLQQENYGVEVRDVASSTSPKGNAMLRVWAQLCHV